MTSLYLDSQLGPRLLTALCKGLLEGAYSLPLLPDYSTGCNPCANHGFPNGNLRTLIHSQETSLPGRITG